jgi:hypothetical protein
MQPTTLTEAELDAVLRSVSPKGIDYQAGRICRLLAHKHSVRSGIVAHRCSVSNISDVVSKSINPHIEHLDIFVSCVKPPARLNNKFGQRSGDHYWSFYRMLEAANDESYDDELADDLEAVKQRHPGVAGESDAHGWIADLTRIEDVPMVDLDQIPVGKPE